MDKTDSEFKISKHITKKNDMTSHIIEDKQLEVSGKNAKEVKKIFDEEWKKE